MPHPTQQTMPQNTAYQYKAIGIDSYNSLAAYAVTIPATVTLHPGLLTIVISGNATKEVGEFIDSEGLSFHINPIAVHNENLCDVIDNETTDAATLRRIIYSMMEKKRDADVMQAEAINGLNNRLAACENNLKEAQKRRDDYRKWWTNSNNELNRVKRQIEAISLLYHSIFPEK